ncbi:MAG: methyl-accepting chemotaxis protein [Planctomycetota bacterium]|jgi:methyl-accepting chemotaxis protein
MRNRIKTKVVVGYTVMCVLVLVCGGVGLYGIDRLSGSLDYLVGPAWETAEGAMEVMIEVESQMIAADQIERETWAVEARESLDAAVSAAHRAFNTMAAAELVSEAQLDLANRHREEYARSLTSMLTTHEAMSMAKQTLAAHADGFIRLQEHMAALGDRLVENLQESPDAVLTWKDGVENSWNAADSAKEVSVAFLRQLHELRRLEGTEDSEPVLRALKKALQMQQEASDRLLATSVFSESAEGAGHADRTYAEAYAQMFETHKTHQGVFVTALREFQQAKLDYRMTADKLLKTLRAVQSTGVAAVESEVSRIAVAKQQARWAMTVALLASVLFGVGMAILVTRAVVGPIAEVVARLREIAQGKGDLTTRLVIRTDDEIGELAGWFNEFLENQRSKIGSIARNSSHLQVASEGLAVVSDQMASTAEETSVQANVVAESSEEVSGNLDKVATAADELNSVVREIARSAVEAAKVAVSAVREAENTTTTVARLGESGNEIGAVIKVINSIAEQTNLLALNATIEAARAGEAGKGFAVVANEVKELAKETASATEDIGSRIESIQSDTAASVAAIEGIRTVITRISEIQNTIATAVEEQTTTTNEIGRNVTEAASGSAEIARSIAAVADAARMTASGVHQTRTSAGELAKMAADLDAVVAGFQFRMPLDEVADGYGALAHEISSQHAVEDEMGIPVGH